jgi:hypothetical protein
MSEFAMAVLKRNKTKEEELIMRITSRGLIFRLVIAFIAVLLVGGPAFADITLELGSVDLTANRTEVDLDGTVVCDLTTDTVTGTPTIYQVHGRLLNIGLGTVTFDCSTGTWSAIVNAIQGLKFQPGPATLVVQTIVNSAPTPVDFGFKVNLH